MPAERKTTTVNAIIDLTIWLALVLVDDPDRHSQSRGASVSNGFLGAIWIGFYRFCGISIQFFVTVVLLPEENAAISGFASNSFFRFMPDSRLKFMGRSFRSKF